MRKLAQREGGQHRSGFGLVQREDVRRRSGFGLAQREDTPRWSSRFGLAQREDARRRSRSKPNKDGSDTTKVWIEFTVKNPKIIIKKKRVQPYIYIP